MEASSNSTITPRKKPRRKLDTTRLTRDYYRSKGWCITYVQRTVKINIPGTPFKKTRSYDAWNIADHIAFPYPERMRPEQGTIKLIQTCAVSGISEHVKKILDNARGCYFLEASPGHSITIAAWARGKQRGDPMRKRFRHITLADYAPIIAALQAQPGVCSPLWQRKMPEPKPKPVPLFEMENVNATVPSA